MQYECQLAAQFYGLSQLLSRQAYLKQRGRRSTQKDFLYSSKSEPYTKGPRYQ